MSAGNIVSFPAFRTQPQTALKNNVYVAIISSKHDYYNAMRNVRLSAGVRVDQLRNRK